jgi:hypothetical protein
MTSKKQEKLWRLVNNWAYIKRLKIKQYKILLNSDEAQGKDPLQDVLNDLFLLFYFNLFWRLVGAVFGDLLLF